VHYENAPLINYVEIVRLHTIYAWFTVLHVIILVIFLIALVQLQLIRAEEQMDFQTAGGRTGETMVAAFSCPDCHCGQPSRNPWTCVFS
ncbi:MAG TPA: hypothetical protein VKP04_01690, partial [Ktedonobacteraceae bacterium]|nr:hypothetical protein [Ktedonobacteraceae bacterium]